MVPSVIDIEVLNINTTMNMQNWPRFMQDVQFHSLADKTSRNGAFTPEGVYFLPLKENLRGAKACSREPCCCFLRAKVLPSGPPELARFHLKTLQLNSLAGRSAIPIL